MNASTCVVYEVGTNSCSYQASSTAGARPIGSALAAARARSGTKIQMFLGCCTMMPVGEVFREVEGAGFSGAQYTGFVV